MLYLNFSAKHSNLYSKKMNFARNVSKLDFLEFIFELCLESRN